MVKKMYCAKRSGIFSRKPGGSWFGRAWRNVVHTLVPASNTVMQWLNLNIPAEDHTGEAI